MVLQKLKPGGCGGVRSTVLLFSKYSLPHLHEEWMLLPSGVVWLCQRAHEQKRQGGQFKTDPKRLCKSLPPRLSSCFLLREPYTPGPIMTYKKQTWTWPTTWSRVTSLTVANMLCEWEINTYCCSHCGLEIWAALHSHGWLLHGTSGGWFPFLTAGLAIHLESYDSS